MRLKEKTLLLSHLFMAACVSRLFAATVTVNSSADAFVANGPSGQLSTQNFGAAGALGVAGAASAKGPFQSVILFDLSAAKTTLDAQFGAGLWTPGSVSLQLTAASPNNPVLNATHAGQVVVLQMENTSWTEGAGAGLPLTSESGVGMRSQQKLAPRGLIPAEPFHAGRIASGEIRC